MPLAGYQPETRIVKAGKTAFEVRGLALNDVAVLIREHFPDLDAIVDLVSDFGSITTADMQPLVAAMVSQTPGLAANIIALAAGEGDAADAEKLPGPVQMKALLDIGELTFTDVGGVGKAWETVAALLRSKEAMAKLSQTRKSTG
jgi:hypothetical protein